MNNLNLSILQSYIEDNIWPRFHQKKLEKIESITLNDIIKRKNPYLFKAKNTQSANDFIKSVLDASLSSGEETTFGNFMEEIAIVVCEQVYGGRKSAVKGLDLEFESNGDKYLISIKSGPNWGNSGQIRQMLTNFTSAKKILQTSGGSRHQSFILIEGCCYGSDASPNKGTHFKYCGQDFWELISGGNDTLYKDIIEPIGHRAKDHNEVIVRAASAKLNILTAEFITRFCGPLGNVKWDDLIEFNSGRRVIRIRS